MNKSRYFPAILGFLLLTLFLAHPPTGFSQALRGKANVIDYCRLFDSSRQDTEKYVTTKAFMTYSTVSRIDGGDSFFYFPECNNGDYFAIADFSSNILHKNQPKFFEKLPSEKNFIFEVEFSGQLETSLVPSFGHLSWSRSQFHVAEIKSIRDVPLTAEKPDSEAETPLTNKFSNLVYINKEIMLSFLVGKKGQTFNDYISDSFILTDSLGKNYSRENYSDRFNIGLPGDEKEYEWISVSGGQVKAAGNAYKIYGSAGLSNKNGKELKLKYENTFLFKNNSWLITNSKISNFR